MQSFGIPDRPSWGHRLDFLAALLSFHSAPVALRLAFGTCVSGGAAFFLLLLFVFVFFSFPAAVMETGLGQICGRSGVEAWAWICPLFKGAAFVWLAVKLFLSCQMAALAGKAVFYLISAVAYSQDPPWSSCSHPWNSAQCRTNGSSGGTSTPAEDFLFRRVLLSGSEYRAGAVVPGPPFNWHLAGCVLLAWTCCAPVLLLGIRVLPKVLCGLLSAAFGLSLVLVGRLALMPGSASGMKHFLYPQLRFRTPEVFWVLPVFDLFSGSLFTIASYNQFGRRHILDCFAAHVYCVAQLLLVGSMHYIASGVLALVQKRGFMCAALSTTHDAFFVTTAPALSLASGGAVWNVLLFLYLFLSLLAALLTNSEVVVTALLDVWGSHSRWARFVCSAGFVGLGLLLNALASTPTSYALTDLDQFLPLFFFVSAVIFIFLCAFHFGSRRLAVFLGIINGCYLGTKYFIRTWNWVLIPLLVITVIKQLFYGVSLLNIGPFVVWFLFILLQFARAGGSCKARLASLVRPVWHAQLAQRIVWKKRWAPLDFGRGPQGEAATDV